MIEAIDIGLEAFFRASPELTTDIDMSFEAPDRDWSSKLGNRPTVNLFLWEINHSADRGQAGLTTVTNPDGSRVHKQPLPFVELAYVATVWTPLRADERRLLNGITRELLASPSIPAEHLPESIRHIDEPLITLGRGDGNVDIMKFTDGKVKTGLHLTVITQFDTQAAFTAKPPVEDISVAVRQPRRRIAGEIAHAARRRAVGATVRSPLEQTVVNNAGQFLIEASPGDEIVIEADPPLVATVPSVGGIRIE